MARTLLRWVAPGFPGPSAALPIRKPRAVRMLPPAAIKTHSSSGAGGGGNYVQLTDEELMGQCEMDRFKSSGPGGQHRNKTESAVRLKHLPTGIIAQAVEDRSQHKNRASALARLRTLLALKGRKSTLINIVLHQNLFRFFLQSRQLDIQILVLKLVLIIQSLLRGCKLYLT